jgi:serine/threonine-protein kinase
LSKVAAGGMGVVYKAKQIELGRVVAVKILFSQFASNKQHLQQFFREAKLASSLNHPNLVHIFDLGDDQDFHYYSMELVEGENLGDLLAEKEKFSQKEAMDYIIQAGEGLKHMHDYDIVHRDIKPSNFIIRSDGIVKIMDLGLARQLYRAQKKASTMGTPYYMSPELLSAPLQADQRADIYALGVSFYRMLSGKYPITGNTAKEIVTNIHEQYPIPIQEHEQDVNDEVAKVIEKMLEKDPEQRYQNMGEILNDLDRILLD